jgi:ring-1,2-phenylacetyl-CoA epoxidase subunit PaaC
VGEDGDADALAFDRQLDEYRCAPLVELRLIDDWALTIARRYLYEEADRVRIEALTESDDTELAGLAAKIDREEVYHRLHAELWAARLRDEPRFTAAVDRLWPFALAVVDPPQREELARRVGRPSAKLAQTSRRGTHTSDLTALWEEMTEVRRSEPGAQW